jgi:integrase
MQALDAQGQRHASLPPGELEPGEHNRKTKQLRHAHATELINSGVSIEVVRRRLGHACAETTQVYTLLADKVADAEIRAARRRRGRSAS